MTGPSRTLTTTRQALVVATVGLLTSLGARSTGASASTLAKNNPTCSSNHLTVIVGQWQDEDGAALDATVDRLPITVSNDGPACHSTVFSQVLKLSESMSARY